VHQALVADALKGLHSAQLNTISFHHDPVGKDSSYALKFPGKSPQEIMDLARAHGFQGATLIPDPNGNHELRLLDFGRNKAADFEQLRALAAQPTETRGNLVEQGRETADGGRSEAAQGYRRTIAESGSQVDPRLRLDGDLGQLAEANHSRLTGPQAAFMPMAGERGKGFEEAKRRGRLFASPYDLAARYEISDDNAQWRNPKIFANGKEGPDIDPHDAYRLPEILDHPTLYQDYPDLRDVNVIHDPKAEGAAFFRNDPQDRKAKGLIKLGDPTDKRVLIHELQHWIQRYDDWPGKGTSLEAAARRLDMPMLRDQFANRAARR
jgi:hypothetical protein